MPRNVELSRAEAEFLTDLLMLSDHYLARDLSQNLRERFGMVSEEREREARKALSVKVQPRLRTAGVWVRHNNHAQAEQPGHERDSAPFEAADLIDMQELEIAELRARVAQLLQDGADSA